MISARIELHLDNIGFEWKENIFRLFNRRAAARRLYRVDPQCIVATIHEFNLAMLFHPAVNNTEVDFGFTQ